MYSRIVICIGVAFGMRVHVTVTIILIVLLCSSVMDCYLLCSPQLYYRDYCSDHECSMPFAGKPI
jgi:hypothetical protein